MCRVCRCPWSSSSGWVSWGMSSWKRYSDNGGQGRQCIRARRCHPHYFRRAGCRHDRHPTRPEPSGGRDAHGGGKKHVVHIARVGGARGYHHRGRAIDIIAAGYSPSVPAAGGFMRGMGNRRPPNEASIVLVTPESAMTPISNCLLTGWW
ncbi:hypothetical protein BJX63DRAFT_407830 [Aspergillus granulosus]|uniref:Uncharacterized protein n=1 Tax=Aspergillus granulosus TaxID=176169 RepID=A0ABR4H098_9EURO